MMTAEGYQESALRLDDTIRAGATGTEIFMGLRFHLEDFLNGNPTCTDTLKHKARELHAVLDKALS